MSREAFRLTLGVAVIVVHAICYVIIWYFKDHLLTSGQKTDVALLFMPITSAYVVAIVKSAIEEQAAPARKSQTLRPYYCVIVSVFVVLCLSGLIATVWAIEGDLDVARRQILLFEIAFGTAFGIIASDLFGKQEFVKNPSSRETN